MTLRLSKGLLISVPLLVGCGQEEPASPRPDLDVVLIVVDTLRADHVGCYGYERPTTPTIDQLAFQGVRFADCTAQASWTAPSMVSLLTARRTVSDFVRMPPERSLTDILREAGFRTLAFQDNILLAPGAGFEHGFEVYEMEAGPKVHEAALAADDGRPLFLYFHFVDPHDPYAPLPAFDLFRPEPPRAEAVTAFFDHLRRLHPERDAAQQLELAAAAATEVERQVALYDGDVRQADKRVAYVLDLLARHGRLERSLIVLAADHGECLWQQPEAAAALTDEARQDLLRAFKQTHNTLLSQSLVHVPLVLKGPGVPANVVVEGPVENVDIVPTLLDLLGLPQPEGLDGRSLRPLYEAAAAGQPAPGKDVVFSNSRLFSAARLRDGSKLVLPWDAAGPDPPQLFDLLLDPREQRPAAPADGILDQRLAGLIEELRRTGLQGGTAETVIDDETRQRLEALGYVGPR